MKKALWISGLLLLALQPGRAAAQNSGPDVTVYELQGIGNWGAENGIRGYSVATTSCNSGDQPINWCDNAGGCGNGTTIRDHPVIAQNMYRLKDGRFEQIGASWLKHSFESVNFSGTGCGNGSCVNPPLGSNQLGVGCTDPYTTGMNGNRPLGPKSEVNAATGAFPFPPSVPAPIVTIWHQRMAVAETDLASAQNPGALYFVEGHYIAPDDAMADNGRNNASYRRVTVADGTFNVTAAASTVRQKAAIEAWPVVDPTVELINLDLPSVPIERFHVARKVTALGGGMWRYEYAVHNMNSQRAADALTINFGQGTSFANAGFRDIDSHSGEAYDTADWEISTTVSSVSWTAPFFSPPQNANALRWATMYNFFFDASRPPTAIASHSLSLFEAGMPTSVVFLETVQEQALFADGFESGKTAAWSGP